MPADHRLAELFGMYSEAIFAIDGDDIIYYNAAAQKFLPGSGSLSAGDIFPDAVLGHESDSFVGELDLTGKRVSYSAARFDGLRIFSILSVENDSESDRTTAFSSMCGEMKNYLALLKLATGIVLPYVEDSGNERLSKYSAMIMKSYYSILRLTANMEILGDEAVNEIGLRRSRFNLADVCADFISSCTHLLSNSGISLSFQSSHKSISISADKDKLLQMLLNMISNSVLYTPAGGSIVLSLTLSNENVLIKVKDTGCGISDELKARAWQSFGVSKNFTDTRGGAGFGMAAVSQIARMHGGSVFLESRLGEGTTVTAALPVKEEKVLLLRDELASYGGDSLSPFLAGLSTVLGSDKFTQKYLD